MISITWIISFSIFLVSFFGIVLSTLFFAKSVDEYKFSFMRMFPFEVVRTSEKNSRYYLLSTYLFSGMCFSPLILISEGTGKLANLDMLSILITCLFGLAALCFLFLNIFDATHVKAHLSLFTIFACLTLLAGVLVTVRGFVAFDLFKKHGTTNYFLIVLAAIEELVIPFILIIIFNPNLRFWARLDKVEDKYVRPKKFPLAYSEWGILLSLFLLEIGYFIQLIVK